MNALFNGHEASDLASSRGLHYGDGVFRTVLAWDGALLDWDLHLAKLQRDCDALSLEMPPASVLMNEAVQLTHSKTRAVIKLMVIRKTGGRGYRPESTRSDRLLLVYPAPRYPETHWTHGITGFRCSLALASQPALAGIKHLNRLEQVLASRDWPENADEGILCDQESRPVCGTRSNLFWINGRQLHTPALTQCGVAGIMRTKIMALAESLNIRVHVRPTKWEELMAADEVFVCNAIIGIWPLRRLAQRDWSAPGAVTAELISALRRALY